MIGVDPFTLLNWEKGKTTPHLRVLPTIIQFLGYDPRPRARTFPGRIRQLREALGLSIDELAEKIDVDPSTVQKWERLGYKPHPRLFARLARVLSIPEPQQDAPFGVRLRARRLALGLTQKEAAARIGVGRGEVSEWEGGNRGPELQEIERVWRVLQVLPK